MSKTTKTYWNVFVEKNAHEWEVLEGSNEKIKQLTLAIDKKTGDYTRLTYFKPGSDTRDFGSNTHDYPEEIYIISGKLYDGAFDKWLAAGDYCSRPPGEVHGPFRTEQACLVLEISYPSQAKKHLNT